MSKVKLGISEYNFWNTDDGKILFSARANLRRYLLAMMLPSPAAVHISSDRDALEYSILRWQAIAGSFRAKGIDKEEVYYTTECPLCIRSRKFVGSFSNHEAYCRECPVVKCGYTPCNIRSVEDLGGVKRYKSIWRRYIVTPCKEHAANMVLMLQDCLSKLDELGRDNFPQ